jgi:hypothetical protein
LIDHLREVETAEEVILEPGKALAQQCFLLVSRVVIYGRGNRGIHRLLNHDDYFPDFALDPSTRVRDFAPGTGQHVRLHFAFPFLVG